MDPFARLEGAEVSVDPFPHVVLEEALQPDLAAALVREMPSLDVLTRGAPPESNKRFTLSSADLLGDLRVSETWRSTIRAGLSQSLLDRVARLFADHVERELPGFAKRFGPLRSLRARQRVAGEPRGAGVVSLDAQIAVNTPALTSGTTVRTPHLDRTDKFFVGLLYLRPENDASRGADLELYRFADAVPAFGPKRSLSRDAVVVARTIPYRTNTLVLLLNGPRAVHGVSPREATDHPRYFLNLVGEMSGPIFEVDGQEAPPGASGRERRWWQRLLGR